MWKPIIILYVLYQNDKDYRACFIQTFRRDFENYDDDDQDLDGDVQDLDGDDAVEETVINETSQSAL